MFHFQVKYLNLFPALASIFLIAGCNPPPESTKDQCQRFVQVMQIVVNERQTFKNNPKFDRDTLSLFKDFADKSVKSIKDQPQFNDNSLINYQGQFSKLYKQYNSAGSNLFKSGNVEKNPTIGYASLNLIQQSIPEEKKLITDFNSYCNAHGFQVKI